MTKQEILALSISDLEQEIAQRIFGLFIFHELKDGKMYVGRDPLHHEWQELPKYARDIVAAKSATDALMRTDQRWDVHISCYSAFGEPKYRVEMINWFWLHRSPWTILVDAATEEEARARAALVAYWRMKQ
jgi:hypothetical protein